MQHKTGQDRAAPDFIVFESKEHQAMGDDYIKFGAPLRRGSRWVIPIKVAKSIFKKCDDYYKLRHN